MRFAIWYLLTFRLMATGGEKRAATFIATHMCRMSHIDFNPQPFARMQIRFQFRKLLLRPILWRDDIFIAVLRRFMENGTHTTANVSRIPLFPNENIETICVHSMIPNLHKNISPHSHCVHFVSGLFSFKMVS